MATDLFQVLGLAGLAAPTPSDVFADLPPSEADRRPARPARAVPDDPDRPDEQDVLGLLHEEFRRVLADPWQLLGRVQESPGPASPVWRAPDADPLPPASGAPHLLQTVLQRESLDGFIARFVAELDPGEEPALLLETRPEEVLQLFAPSQGAARHAPLPLTTRRDHHALSPDSAVQIGTFATVAQALLQELSSPTPRPSGEASP